MDFSGGGHAGIALSGAQDVVVVGVYAPDLAQRAGVRPGARLLAVNGIECRGHAHAIGMIEAARHRRRACCLRLRPPRHAMFRPAAAPAAAAAAAPASWLSRVATCARRGWTRAARRARVAG